MLDLLAFPVTTIVASLSYIAAVHAKQWLDMPVGAVAWSVPQGVGGHAPLRADFARLPSAVTAQHTAPPASSPAAHVEPAARRLAAAVEEACHALIAHEAEIARLDAISGDGDCGETMRRAAVAVHTALHTGRVSLASSSALLTGLAAAIEGGVGGTSGAIYAILLTTAGNKARALGDALELDAPSWGEVLQAGA